MSTKATDAIVLQNLSLLPAYESKILHDLAGASLLYQLAILGILIILNYCASYGKKSRNALKQNIKIVVDATLTEKKWHNRQEDHNSWRSSTGNPLLRLLSESKIRSFH